MTVKSNVCNDRQGDRFCEFIAGHGGKFHGTFTPIKHVWRDGPFAHLWMAVPKQLIRANKINKPY